MKSGEDDEKQENQNQADPCGVGDGEVRKRDIPCP